MRYFLVLLLSAFVISSAISNNFSKTKAVRVSYTGIAHLDTAISYIGTREKTGHNDGIQVERFLASVGLKAGQPYCASFVSYCLTATGSKFPIRSGLARKFKIKKSISAKSVLKGKVIIPAGSIVGWELGRTIKGHLGLVLEEWFGKKGHTVEANTSSGIKGSQNDGDGVYDRWREIQLYAYFRITFFTVIEDNYRKDW